MPVLNRESNPIIITGPISANEVIVQENICVQKVIWAGGTTAAHKAMLKNRDGDEKVGFVADAPGSSGQLMYTFDLHQQPLLFEGINCDDLDSGRLLIYWTSRSPKQESFVDFRIDAR